jgi:hypothetical protein
MELDVILKTVVEARSQDSTAWIPEELTRYLEKSGQWSLAKRDCETSRLPDDSAPGDSLASWVVHYATWGSPLDQVRVRYRKGTVDKSWFVSPLANERTGWERALDVLLPLLADKSTRDAIAATIGKAARPMIQEAIGPVIRAQVVDTLTEILQDEVDESERDTDLPRRGSDLAGQH